MNLKFPPATLPLIGVGAVIVALSVLYLADDDRLGRPPATTEERSAVEAAGRYVAARYPESSALERPARIAERRGMWEVTYPLPPERVGGGPIVTIDKTTGNVVAANHGQ